jgi:hypothetical protein
MWKVNYHINFNLVDGSRVTKTNSMSIKSSKVLSKEDAISYLLKKYKKGFQPLVNMDDIFITVKNEEFIIDYIEKIP